MFQRVLFGQNQVSGVTHSNLPWFRSLAQRFGCID
jgi:hypothetical protein